MNTILTIKDSPFFLEQIESFFKDSGNTLLSAKNGEEVLERLDSTTPDLILMDLHMPDIQGDELCNIIRHKPRTKDIPIIMITASDNIEAMDKCLEAGCDEFIAKPIDWTEFRDKVKKYIKLPQ